MRIDRMSASKAKTWESCEFKYFLNYTLFAPQKAHFAAELGSLLHVVFERYAQTYISPDGIDEEGKDKAWLDSNWKKIVLKEGFQTLTSWEYNTHILKESKNCDSCKAFKNGKCGVVNRNIDDFDGCPWNAWVEACNMVSRVIDDETEFGVFSNPDRIIGSEEEFRFDIMDGENGYTVNGIIDLVLDIDEDTIEIVDYKTGRHKLSYSAAEKDIQLMLYYLAARKMYPHKKHHMVTIFYVNGGKKQITLAFSEKTEQQITDRIIMLWRAIKSEKRPTRIADKSNGAVQPNHICKYLCNWDLCQQVHPKFVEYIDAGGNVEDLHSLEDLGFEVEEKND